MSCPKNKPNIKKPNNQTLRVVEGTGREGTTFSLLVLVIRGYRVQHDQCILRIHLIKLFAGTKLKFMWSKSSISLIGKSL